MNKMVCSFRSNRACIASTSLRESVAKPLKYFHFEDYGFPTQYASLLASSNKWLKANPELFKKIRAAITHPMSGAATKTRFDAS